MLGIDLAGGSLIFLGFLVAATLAAAYAIYGRRGSGITEQPYGKVYGGAPGANRAASRPTGRDRDVVTWSRGTR
jgi:hypothetical protein